MSAIDASTEGEFQISTAWFGPSLVVLRVLIGWHFLYAGLTKLLNPGWSAAGFLTFGVAEENPVKWFFTGMAESSYLWLIDILNMTGLTLIGLALILGIAFRFSAFWGSVIMLFYWTAHLPLEHSIIVSEHIIYVAVLFGLGAFGAGRYFGLDEYIEEWPIVENNPWLRYFLG
ncbi:MAG: DoxX family protein [Halobacteriales archaeon]